MTIPSGITDSSQFPADVRLIDGGDGSELNRGDRLRAKIGTDIGSMNEPIEDLILRTNYLNVKLVSKLLPRAADPALRDNGLPLEVGDEYYNTTDLTSKVWDGVQWEVRSGVSKEALNSSAPAQGAELVRSQRGLTAQEIFNDAMPRTLLEFIPRAHWSGVRDGTNIVDMTPYIQAAIDSGEHIQSRERLQLRMDSPIFLYGGTLYDFGLSTLLPTDAFGVIQHKVFSADVGQYLSGQYFTLKNAQIIGDVTKKYNAAGAGLKFNKDLGLNGYAVYDGTIENVTVKDMYYCFDDVAQSGAWMTTFKHMKGINCPIGFAKSIGTTILMQNVYMLGGHRGFFLDNLYGFDMIGCAHDGATDYDPDFLDSRILITNSQGNMQTMRAEYLSGKKRLMRVDNSKLNIGIVSFSNASLDATANDASLMDINLASEVTIGSIVAEGGVSSSGANKKNVFSVTGGSNVVVQGKSLPTITGSNVYNFSNFGGRVYGSNSPTALINSPNGYMEQTRSVTLFVSNVGSDTNSGLTESSPLQTIAGAFAELNRRYLGHDVTITLISSTTFQVSGTNKLSTRKLTIAQKSGITAGVQFVVTGGIIARIGGIAEVVLDINALTVSGSPGAFGNGIMFPSIREGEDFSLDTVQIKASTITLPANCAIAGGSTFGYNGMLSVGVRDSAITGAGASSSYICYLGSCTAQITRGGGSITTCGITNGTQVSTSNLYYG